MANAVENMVYCLRTILIRITVGPISFVFLELSKFALVLTLAFWITVGIFMMWESIMPEGASRLSAAAATVVANTSGLMPSAESKDNANESSNYPFVVDLPKTESSTLEAIIKDEAVLQTAAAEGKSASSIKNESETAEVAFAEATVSKPPSTANANVADDTDKLFE